MLNRVKWSIGVFIFMVGFIISYQMGIHSLNDEIFVDVQELQKQQLRRNVAAIKKNNPLKNIRPILMSTSPRDILLNAKVQLTQNNEEETFKIILGHFSSKQKVGSSPVFACEAYDKVSVLYEGIGLTTNDPNSKSPTMLIETKCVMDPDDELHLKPIHFNPNLFANEAPAEGLKMAEDGSYSIRFENIESSNWPKRWKFVSVILEAENKKSIPSILLERKELDPNNQNKLDLTW